MTEEERWLEGVIAEGKARVIAEAKARTRAIESHSWDGDTCTVCSVYAVDFEGGAAPWCKRSHGTTWHRVVREVNRKDEARRRLRASGRPRVGRP